MEKVRPVRHIPLRGSRRCTRVAVVLPRTEAVTTAGDDGVLRITSVRANDGSNLDIGAHEGRIGGVVELTTDVVATAGLDGMLRVWKLRDSRRPRDEHNLRNAGGLTSMCSLRPGRILVGTSEGHLILFEYDPVAERLQPLGKVGNAHERRINDIHARRDYFVTASNDHTAALWKVSDCDRVKVFTHTERVFSVGIGEHYIATGILDRVFMFNNREPNFSLATVISVSCGIVWRCIPMGRDQILYTGNDTLNFSTVESKNVMARIQTSAVHVLDADILPDGRIVYAGNSGETSGIIEVGRELTSCLRAFVNMDEPPSTDVIDPRIHAAARQVEIPNGPKRQPVKLEHNGNGNSYGESRDPRLRGRDYNNRYEGRANRDERRSSYERRERVDDIPYRNVYNRQSNESDSGRAHGYYGKGEGERYLHGRNEGYHNNVQHPTRPRDENGRNYSNRYNNNDNERTGRHPVKFQQGNNYGEHRYNGEQRRLAEVVPCNTTEREQKEVEKETSVKNQPDGPIITSVVEKMKTEEKVTDTDTVAMETTEPGEITDEQPTEKRLKKEDYISPIPPRIAEKQTENVPQPIPNTNQSTENPTEEPSLITKIDSPPQSPVPMVQETKTDTTDTNRVEQEPSIASSQKALEIQCSSDPSSDTSKIPQADTSPRKSEQSEQVQADPAELAIAAMNHWQEKGVSKQIVAQLEPAELAAMMAAFMLRYRTSWHNKFEPLRNCLFEFFDQNLLTADDVVGVHAVPSKELSENIIEALKSDESVGAKMGLINGVERFLETVNKSPRSNKS